MPRRPYRPTVKPWKEESYRRRLAGFRMMAEREAAKRAEFERREAAKDRLAELERQVESNPQMARNLRRWRLR